MRIAEVATLLRPVPPEGEGSVESLVYTITEGLVLRGHEVTLYAVADSRTSARLRSPVEKSYTSDPDKWDWNLYEAFQVREAFRAWRDFDVIHCHSYHHGLLFCDFVPIPSLHSVHIEPGPDYPFLARRTANRFLHFASNYQARAFEGLEGIHVIPHGIDPDLFLPVSSEEKEDYLAFLGRFIPEKGPLEAIRIAKRTGRPLKMAAPPNDYLNEILKPFIDGVRVEYVGELKGAEKSEFLARAHALLYPVQTPEPFGLVLIEAMACGTPVVALNVGAVPEIVKDGVNGFTARNEEDMAPLIERCGELDPMEIRASAKQSFSAGTMVDRLEKLLLSITSRENPPPPNQGGVGGG